MMGLLNCFNYCGGWYSKLNSPAETLWLLYLLKEKLLFRLAVSVKACSSTLKFIFSMFLVRNSVGSDLEDKKLGFFDILGDSLLSPTKVLLN